MKQKISFKGNGDRVSKVIHELLKEYDIATEEYAYSHKALICTIRNNMWLWLYETFDVSTSFLGGMFARNHATIIAGIKRARWLLDAHDKDAEDIRDKILLIDKMLQMDKEKRIYISLPSSDNEEADKERAKIAIAKYKAQGFERVVTCRDMLDLCYSEKRQEEWVGRRIENLLSADMVIFANQWFEDKKCLLERDACQRFEKEVFTDGKI